MGVVLKPSRNHPPYSSTMFHQAVASPSFDQTNCAPSRQSRLPDKDPQLCQAFVWMAGAANCSARKWHSKRPKNNQRSFATCSITFSWSLVCTCIVPLFRSLMKAFVAWTSIPPCKKTGLQTLRLTPNLKLIHVSLVLTLVHGPTRISKVLTPHRHHKLTVV